MPAPSHNYLLLAPLASKAASYIHDQTMPGLNQTLHRSQLDHVATAAERLATANPRYQSDQTHSSSLGGLVIYLGSESVACEDFLLHYQSRRSKTSLDIYQNRRPTSSVWKNFASDTQLSRHNRMTSCIPTPSCVISWTRYSHWLCRTEVDMHEAQFRTVDNGRA
jgi:hypothetical protein